MFQKEQKEYNYWNAKWKWFYFLICLKKYSQENFKSRKDIRVWFSWIYINYCFFKKFCLTKPLFVVEKGFKQIKLSS
jgi:hypothetical protein